MKEQKGLEVLSFSEFMAKDYGPKITWKHDKNYLTAYRDGKETPVFIHKNRCLTKEAQFGWMQHIGDKDWIHTYNFKEAFIKALKSWDLWKL